VAQAARTTSVSRCGTWPWIRASGQAMEATVPQAAPDLQLVGLPTDGGEEVELALEALEPGEGAVGRA
jgi:hypothetical protein